MILDNLVSKYYLREADNTDDNQTQNQDNNDQNNTQEDTNDNTTENQDDDEYNINDPDTEDNNQEDNQEDEANDNQEDEYNITDPDTEDTDDDTTENQDDDEYSINDPDTEDTEDNNQEDTTDDTDPSARLKELEKSIFDQLPKEMQVAKSSELKKLYTITYNKCQSIIDIITTAEKQPNQIKTYDYILNSLIDLQKYIKDYLANIYDSKTYIENMTELQKYLAILDTINGVFEDMSKQVQ